ncbi:ribokinase [Colletotrichum incanum]|uniref:Ribokinase n=1 Tax=Colletotrichum incanum TaxID=1573173 RepID=A0A162P2D1_COLIC|nr:ribokinase [Colletotrichum incanum]OHW91617.1 ribokinase [Colletotrichum incanum]
MAASKTPQITVLGSLNIDLTSYVPHHPLPGETLTSYSVVFSPGGKGANQAVACAKLSRSRDAPNDATNESASVSMIGVVGSDSYGDLLLKNLGEHGVRTDRVAVGSDLKTGIAIIVVDQPTGQNRIILAPEANHTVTPDKFGSLPETLDPKPDLLVMQLEVPIETVLAALRSAKAAAVPVLLNPAPAQWLPDAAYDGLAHLVINETEATILSGCRESDLETPRGLEVVGSWFLAKKVRNVIITLGGRGVYYACQDGAAELIPAEKVKVVDTTAAGDTFVGSYCVAVVNAQAKGEAFDISSAIKSANRAAAKTVERKGAQASIPWRDELQ